MNINWDDSIGELLVEWKKICENLKRCEKIVIKRCYFIYNLSDPIKEIYLHGLLDASQSAYAACIYLQSVTQLGNVTVKFVTAKSCVIPIKKPFTIPRLELLENYILLKLICNVYDSICDDIEVKDILCWRNSQISLAWIKDINSEFKTFVQNRLIAIRNNVHPDNWKYCSTNENLADIITKIKMCDISANNLWWEGPHFLKNMVEYNNRSRKQTKIEIDDFLLNSCNKRIVKTNSYLVTGAKKKNIQNIIDIKNFSTLKKLLIITSWVLCFIQNVKSRICGKKLNLKNYLNSGEINNSKNLWLRIGQEELINSDKFENLKNSLQLKEDEIGLYQCTARISQNSLIPYETRNPITLNRNHV